MNKIDLLPLLDYDIAGVSEEIRGIQPQVELFRLSARSGEGVEALCQWLMDRVRAKQNAV